MKKVIALFGIANSGKTTTIKIAYKLLLRNGALVIKENYLPVELNAILKLGDLIIGIESRGDPGSDLEKSLEDFKLAGCHLVICATRTSGWTVNVVEQLKPDFFVSWRRQSDVSEPNQQSASNKAIAKLIVMETMELIGA